MSKIIAVTSGKGGTGKSSISACLGYALAKQGNRTLIIELDFGLRCMDIMLGMQGNITYDLGDVLEGTCFKPERSLCSVRPVRSAQG